MISLGDIFTGPYKNGSKNTRDYRYFAGFNLFLRIIVLCLYFIPKHHPKSILFSQIALFVIFGGTITIFRPYKRNIHNFIELIFILFLASISIFTVLDDCDHDNGYIINFLFQLIIFGVIVFGYIPYWTIKKNLICCQSCKGNRKRNTSNNEEREDMEITLVDDNWIADRIEHPDNYNEQHVLSAPYDLYVSQPQDITVHGIYGSVSNPELTGTWNSNIDLLSTRDTQSTVAVSERLSIPLHPIASEPDDVNSLTDDDDIL